jgi:hypothetical protein
LANKSKCPKSKNVKNKKAQSWKKSNLSNEVFSHMPLSFCANIFFHCVERQDGDMLTMEDDFDVELEEASRDKGRRPKVTREKRNEKYGYGGSKRKVKRNDEDAGDLSMFDKHGKGGFKGRKKTQRPGKQRRMQQRR